MDNIPWVKKRKEMITIALAALGMACVVLGLVAHTAGKRKRVNIEARKLFDNWLSVSQGDIEQQSFSLSRLNKFLKKNPYLQKNYDSQIAQMLITTNNSKGLALFAKRAINHVDHPFLQTYSLASCDIASGDMDQALARSLQLKQDLSGSFLNVDKLEGVHLLYQHTHLFNLYRIAILFEALGDKEKALHHYLALEAALAEGKKHPFFKKGVDSFLDSFSQNDFSFDDYLGIKTSR